MTALVPSTAARILTPPGAAFATVPFGDVNLIPNVGTHAVSTWLGYPAVFCDVAGTNWLDSDAAFALPSEWAIFVALADCGAISALNPAYHQSGDLDIGVSTNQVDYVADSVGYMPGSPFPLTTPIGADLVVLCLTNNATEGRFLTSADGTIVVDAAAQAASASNLFTVFTDGYMGDAKILGIWLFEGVAVNEVDAIDTMAAIIAEFPLPTMVDGAGTWGIDGAGVVSTDATIFDPITPPAATAGGSATPPAVPTLIVPTGEADPAVWHVAEVMPAPTVFESDGSPKDWTSTSVIDAEWGVLQIIVEGVDITWIDGVRTPTPSWTNVEPYGDQGATIEVPQITIFHARPAWAVDNGNVEIVMVKAGGDTALFQGILTDASVRADTRNYTLEAIGTLFGADQQIRLPSFTTAPQDIGHLIPQILNSAVSRRYSTVANVTTGIKSTVAGGWERRLTGFVQQLLATALKDGKQWTVHCVDRAPVLEQKDTTTVAWTVRAGQRGIVVDLSTDMLDRTNAVYGEGTNADGGRWRGAKYPNWHPDDTPAYPNTNPADTIRVGRTDASTNSGNGVSLWQSKVGQPVTGVFSQGDRAALIRLQRRTGITVDGILGPQSWAASFDTGANTGTLDGAFIAPLAILTEVEPRLYGPDGDDLGANPAYNPDVLRLDRHIEFGQGVSFTTGVAAAEEILARDSVPGMYGTVDFTSDPPEKSRFELRSGENGLIQGWHGEDVLVHVAQADQSGDGTTLSVDTKARDYPTLASINDRRRNATDPAMVARDRVLLGNIPTDRATFDAESPAGRMPKHAVFGGLWDVRKMPMGAFGSIVRTEITATGPAQKFTVGVFGKAVTANQLASLLGNPLTTTASESPWDLNADALEAMGLLQAWGWAKQPEGYYPRSFSNPDGETAAPVTGRMVDDLSWEYVSGSSPWLWVATLASSAGYVEARFYGGVN